MGRRELMKRGSGMKDRDERSRTMEIRMTESLGKIKPTESLRLVRNQSEEITTDPIPGGVY